MKAEGPSEGLRAAAREILRYLVEHPDAKDTVEGILKWWLREEGAKWSEEEVQEAINFLVSRGWLVGKEITPKVYGVKKNGLDEIKRFLSGSYD